ncbi:MAG TPA: hypothetical protein VFW42_01940 [Fluviicoccus sp.]|nr:hypothetical protein [Fluviicoccus sp.]
MERKTNWRAAVVAGLLTLPLSLPASARGRGITVWFGDSERIERLSPTLAEDAQGHGLYAGRKIVMHAFLLPYSIEDGGVVLGVEGDTEHYYRITDREELRDKNPLLADIVDSPPPWSPSWFDKLLGNALWEAMLGLMFYGGWSVTRGGSGAAGSAPPGGHARAAALRDEKLALQQQLVAARHSDPMGALKLGARQVVERVRTALAAELGPPAETLLAALGALAGYAAQSAVRTVRVKVGGQPEAEVFDIRMADQQRYFFSAEVDLFLQGERDSLKARLEQAGKTLGLQSVPDIADILRHADASAGDRYFGVLRVPDRNRPVRKPVFLLGRLWQPLFSELRTYCQNPGEWPLLYFYAIEEALHLTRGTVDPAVAMTIILESAASMARVDLNPPGMVAG